MVLIVGVIGILFYLIVSINGGFGIVMDIFIIGYKFLVSNEVMFDKNILFISVFIIFIGVGFNIFLLYVLS